MIKFCEIPEIFIKEEAEDHRELIKAYVRKRINNFYIKNASFGNNSANDVKPDGLHLVF
jgi:hypothetical protein